MINDGQFDQWLKVYDPLALSQYDKNEILNLISSNTQEESDDTNNSYSTLMYEVVCASLRTRQLEYKLYR